MTETELDPGAVKSSRQKLITLILIAFVPIFVAYAAFFYFPNMAPTGTTNRGELILPPIAATDISEELAGQASWILLQPVDSQCNSDCTQLLYLSRQVVTGLGKDANRIKRMVLSAETPSGELATLLASEHKDVTVIEGSAALLDEVTTNRPILFLVDPNANVMMHFDLEMAGKPMLKDLKHLLKLSNIG